MISRKNLLAVAVSTTLAAGLVACGGESTESKVDAAADKAAAPTAEAPATPAAPAEGKCGGDKAGKEGKCGEGKCGGEKADTEGKCGGAK